MIKKTMLLVICVLMVITTTGCWDNVEINDRQYIFATGVDINEEGKFIFTAEIPRINKGSEDERIIFTEEGESFTDFYNKLFLMTDKVISDRLMQVIILGEKTALDSTKISNLFDELERSPQINRRVKILVSKGTAEDIINTDIPSNPIVGRYLSDMIVKLKKSEYQNVYSFDEALLLLHNFGSGVVPLVRKEKDSLKIESAAVMKDFEMIGELGPAENEILMQLISPSASGMKNVTVDMDGTIVSLAAEDSAVTKKIRIENNQLKADYYVTLYSYVNSFKLGDEKLTDDYLSRVKAKAALKLKTDTDKLIDDMQNKYRADLLRIEEDLAKYHGTEFKKVKDNYEEVFTKGDINVYYNIVIKSTGLVKE